MAGAVFDDLGSILRPRGVQNGAQMAPTWLPGDPWGAIRLRHRFLIDFRLHFGSHFGDKMDQHCSRILKKKRASVLNALFGHLEASGPCFRVDFGGTLGGFLVFFCTPGATVEKLAFWT